MEPTCVDAQWREIPALLSGFLTSWLLGWDRLTRTETGPGDLVPQVPDCYSLDPVFSKGSYGYGLLPREVLWEVVETLGVEFT